MPWTWIDLHACLSIWGRAALISNLPTKFQLNRLVNLWDMAAKETDSASITQSDLLTHGQDHSSKL